MDKENTLYFENSKDKCWSELPSWGKFFIEFGQKIAQAVQENQNSERLVIGLAVPTRAYAAALIGFGLILERSNNSKVALQEHFKDLCQLPKGALISFHEGAKIYRGQFIGYEKKDGQDGIWIALEKKSMQWVPLRRTINIEKVALEDPAELNKLSALPNRQSGKRIRFAYDFVTSLIGSENLQNFFKKTRFDCAILGRTQILRNELNNTSFSVFTEGKFSQGVLQDILRVRKFMGQTEPYHTNIFRMDSSKPPRRPSSNPCVAIFDGAIGFLKWRDFWKNSHCIAIFDRTEPSFDNAISMFNQEYIKNHINANSIELSNLPPNCELMVYKEVSK